MHGKLVAAVLGLGEALAGAGAAVAEGVNVAIAEGCTLVNTFGDVDAIDAVATC
jgi:hypothetical protein